MTYIFRNKESGEIFQDLIFKNDEIQIINPTNEILNKIGWEILEDYPQVEETDEPDETPMSEIEIESEV